MIPSQLAVLIVDYSFEKRNAILISNNFNEL